MRWTSLALLARVAASKLGVSDSNLTRPTYRMPNESIEIRVADLLSRMSIEDKTAQLLQGDLASWINTTTNVFNQTALAVSMTSRANSFYVGHPIPQAWLVSGVKKAQDYLMKNTTLGIPAFVQSEGIHGFLIENATIFNSPIAHACSFNPELVEQMAQVIAREARTLGVNQLFAPLSDLARELRFGRVEETYGEDPYLTGEMAYSYVKGLQSGNVSAMVKHFVGFSAPEQGLNTAPVHGGERELRTTWLPPFKRAIIDAGALSVMSAYHSYDGVPAVADHRTLTDILRKEWDYQYFVISDAGATDRLCDNFKMCRGKPKIDSEAVTLYSLPAGNDVEMGGGSFNFETIPHLVATGKLDVKIVDQAVTRVLRSKFAAGLFENSVSEFSAEEFTSRIHTTEALSLARQLDAESIVLLENKNNLLPLRNDANIAVIGPMADGFMNYGDYVTYKSQFRGSTPFQGIRTASSGRVSFTQGAERWSGDTSKIPEAVKAAKEADVVVIVVGTWTRDQTELWEGLNATTGEHVDVSSLSLIGAQANLVQAIIDTGKPTVVVFSSGKPITEPWISQRAGALIQQFYPSEEGGNALADVLFGKVNPSGKLAVSFPYDVGTLPVYYDYLNSARKVGGDSGQILSNGTISFGHQYVTNTPEPLYEFGYGLSYSTFTYSNMTLSKYACSSSSNDTIVASVWITNSGDRDGKEVVQLYVQDVIASVVVPNKALKGFKKVFIRAGQSINVSIGVKIQDLGLWNMQLAYVVEPGEFVFAMGTSSKQLRLNATLVVTQ